MSEEIKPEVIKRTQDILGKFIKKPQLKEKFLKKPPFRFLHDIVTAVIRETGFLKGLFSSEEMNCETFKDRESKVAFLHKLIDTVKVITGEQLTTKPSKIVAGQEPTKTNELLQAIGKALMNNLSSVEVVEQFKSAKVGKSALTKSKVVPGKAVSQSQSKERAGNKETDKIDAKTVPSKTHGPESKSSQRKDDRKDQRREDKKEHKGGKEKKKSTSLSKTKGIVKKDEEVTISQPDNKNSPRVVNVMAPAVVEDVKSSEHQAEKQNENLQIISSNKDESSEMSLNQVINDDGALTETAVSAEKDESGVDVQVEESMQGEPLGTVRRPAYSGRRLSAKVTTDVRGSGSTSQKEQGQVILNQQCVSYIPDKGDNSEPIVEQEKCLVTDKLKIKSPPPQRPMSVVRPASARRSARPSSARPAAPRIRDRGEVTVAEEMPATHGKVNVISEGELSAELEEDENFVVSETRVAAPAEELRQSPAPEPLDRGHLVTQILETQKELEDVGRVGHEGGKMGMEWEAGQGRGCEVVGREVERLRSSIQTLTRAAYPLGKLMDFLQEDVDAMKRELGSWHVRKKELVRELRQEQALTERSVEPLRLKLHGLQEAIDEQRDHISAVKASILNNDTRIAKLLMNSS